MIKSYKLLFTFILSFVFLTTCTTDELTFPAKFKFKRITLEPKGIYAISGNKTATLVKGKAGTFDEIQKLLMELSEEHLAEGIELNEITLKSNTQIIIKGSNALKESFVDDGEYILEKNKIKITKSENFEGVDIAIDDNNEELRICGMINWVGGKDRGLHAFSFPSIDLCISDDPNVIINDLLMNANNRVYDTISVNLFHWEFIRD